MDFLFVSKKNNQKFILHEFVMRLFFFPVVMDGGFLGGVFEKLSCQKPPNDGRLFCILGCFKMAY
jgi:hypothetical protein